MGIDPLMFGPHPQPYRYYTRLAAGTFRTSLDIGMLVMASGIIGLAMAVLLDGLDVVDLDLDLSTGAFLASLLVITVIGAFALGVASEGRYGAAETVSDYPHGEVMVGRAIGAVLIGALFAIAAGQLRPVVSELPVQFHAVVEVLRAAGVAGLIVVPVLAVPLAWWLRHGLERIGMGDRLELPAIYGVWVIATLILFRMPG